MKNQLSRIKRMSLFMDIILTCSGQKHSKVYDILINKIMTNCIYVNKLHKYKYIKANPLLFNSAHYSDIVLLKHPTKNTIFQICIDNADYMICTYIFKTDNSGYKLHLSDSILSGFRPSKFNIYKFYKFIHNNDVNYSIDCVNHYFDVNQQSDGISLMTEHEN